MRYVAATLTETVAANSAQPPAIVSPGKSLDDAEGAWPRTVVKYKGKLIQNGTLLTGFLSAVGRDHVQVGSRRAVVPYDYLVLATGSSYSSNIKAPNASLEYRHKQMVAENRVLLDAKSVLVIGGGLVGCEIATEIKATCDGDTFPIWSRSVSLTRKVSLQAPRQNRHDRAAECGISATYRGRTRAHCRADGRAWRLLARRSKHRFCRRAQRPIHFSNRQGFRG